MNLNFIWSFAFSAWDYDAGCPHTARLLSVIMSLWSINYDDAVSQIMSLISISLFQDDVQYQLWRPSENNKRKKGKKVSDNTRYIGFQTPILISVLISNSFSELFKLFFYAKIEKALFHTIFEILREMWANKTKILAIYLFAFDNR